MVAALRSWRLRSRLYLAWMFSRHPRFKPIYGADVVQGDLIGQAVHLSDSGYHVAAAMLARAALETRTKRLALLSPDWQSCRKGAFATFVIHLHAVGVISTEQKGRLDTVYSKLSNVCHGNVAGKNASDVNHMKKLVKSSRALIREMYVASSKLLEAQA